MKVLLLNASPKRRLGNSAYFLGILGLGLAGCEVTTRRLDGPKAYTAIFEDFGQIDALVIAAPVYVDAVPAHLLRFLQQAEAVCEKKDRRFRVYALSNCGFYEGKQCGLQLEVLRCWCSRAGLAWGGAVAAGAGEMLGCLRIIPLLAVCIPALTFLVTSLVLWLGGGWSLQAAMAHINPISPCVNLLVFCLFSAGLWVSLFRLAARIRKRKTAPDIYTGLTLCPRFLFLFFANLYWVVRAALHGVPFWRLGKPPEKGDGQKP